MTTGPHDAPAAGPVVRSGDMAWLREARRVRVVSSERTVDLPAEWAVHVADVVDEFDQAVVAVTNSGPLVWIDLEDLRQDD